MSGTSIFVCLEPRRSEWQLGALPPSIGRMMLIGWKKDPEPVDAGVPEEVAAVVARALTSIGRVTFPSSAVHAATGSGWWPLKRAPGPVELTSTTDPQTLIQAFDDAAHPWSMQGQVLLISAPAEAPPEIDRKQLRALLENEWGDAADALSAPGVIGVVRPGVDGDLAGLLTLTADAERTSLAALEGETRRASFDWAVLSEDAFAEHYSS
jgi:hypothetical protein